MTPDTPASGKAPSQRTLAAIVFTDVVSFSARMHTDEVATLKLLKRDFAEMTRLCGEHEGAVLKTTGDGLLLTFTSAVQAVACALAMQRQFAAEAKDPGSENALQHRIGIHLGDVLVQDKDVMGDGVNIAARLQSEAEPGGICISQTVYDVVKNKLRMEVVSLGPKDLKNIAQAMPVYRLLLEAQALDTSGKTAPTLAKAPAGKGGKPYLAIGIAAAVAVGAVVLMGRKAQPAAAPAPAQAPTAAPVTPKPAQPDLAGDLADEYSKQKDVMQELHTLYLDKYDFNGLVLALRDKAENPSAPMAMKAMLRSAEQLVRLKSWLDVALARYTRASPLVAHDLSGDPAKDVSVYLAPDQRLVFIEAGAPVPREWADVKPAVLGSVIVAALHGAKESPRVVFGAQVFARMYALPLMSKALEAGHTHVKDPPAK